MEHIEPTTTLRPTPNEAAADYIFDMIRQLARLAQASGEIQTAIHLDAIIAARRAAEKDRSA